MNANIAIDPSGIHLWLTDCDAIGAEELRDAYRRRLSANERAQEPK